MGLLWERNSELPCPPIPNTLVGRQGGCQRQGGVYQIGSPINFIGDAINFMGGGGLSTSKGAGRDVSEERRHLPFQVLDASAIEGIRGLAGESSSIYSCIQIYKALTPPAPPAYRGATEGPGPPSYVGSSEERPCPDLGLCAPPSAPAGAGAAVSEERRHLPFQVLDASATEGVGGLVGERSSLYSCIQIFLRPLPPCPPQRIAARRKDLGPHPKWDPPRSDPAQISGRALPCPRPQVQLWGVGRPPLPMAAPAEAQKRPPRGPADRLPCPCAVRGTADSLLHVLPCPPLSHCYAPVPALPAHGGRGAAAPRRGEQGPPCP